MQYRIDLYQNELLPVDGFLPCRQLRWEPYWRLAVEDEEGVYVVYELVESPKRLLVAYVGQGGIKDRVETHLREGSEVAQAAVGSYYNLNALWVRVGREEMDGIEGYLAKKLWPIVGKEWPGAGIRVNLPKFIVDSPAFSLRYQRQRWEELHYARKEWL